MKRTILSAVFATVALGSVAWAGEKQSMPVTISFKEQSAHGSMGSARNSADNRQSIGCSISAYSTGVQFMTCWATNEAGVNVVCLLDYPSPAFKDGLAMVSDDSFIKFEWDAANTCVALHVANNSANEPRR